MNPNAWVGIRAFPFRKFVRFRDGGREDQLSTTMLGRNKMIKTRGHAIIAPDFKEQGYLAGFER
jgi:hypothetical protein